MPPSKRTPRRSPASHLFDEIPDTPHKPIGTQSQDEAIKREEKGKEKRMRRKRKTRERRSGRGSKQGEKRVRSPRSLSVCTPFPSNSSQLQSRSVHDNQSVYLKSFLFYPVYKSEPINVFFHPHKKKAREAVFSSSSSESLPENHISGAETLQARNPHGRVFGWLCRTWIQVDFHFVPKETMPESSECRMVVKMNGPCESRLRFGW